MIWMLIMCMDGVYNDHCMQPVMLETRDDCYRVANAYKAANERVNSPGHLATQCIQVRSNPKPQGRE